MNPTELNWLTAAENVPKHDWEYFLEDLEEAEHAGDISYEVAEKIRILLSYRP